MQLNLAASIANNTAFPLLIAHHFPNVFSQLLLPTDDVKDKSSDRLHATDSRKRPREDDRRRSREPRKDFTKAPDPDEPEKMDKEAVQGLMTNCFSGGEDDNVVVLDACKSCCYCCCCYYYYSLLLFFYYIIHCY